MKSRFALLLLALLPWSVFAVEAAPEAGVDYVEIPDGKPYAPLNGKVEVVELFGYTCIHCAHFQPMVSAWHRKQPSYVRFTPVPAAFGGYWMPYARAYYAAAKLRVLTRSHDAMFKALHEDGSLPIQNASAQEIATFYKAYGADPAAFVAAMESPATALLLDRSTEFAMASGIEGTPAIVVNGKYRVTARSPEDVLRVTDFLVAKERAGK